MFQSIICIIAIMFSVYTLDKWELLPDEKTAPYKPEHANKQAIDKEVVKTPQRFTDRIVQKHKKRS